MSLSSHMGGFFWKVFHYREKGVAPWKIFGSRSSHQRLRSYPWVGAKGKCVLPSLASLWSLWVLVSRVFQRDLFLIVQLCKLLFEFLSLVFLGACLQSFQVLVSRVQVEATNNSLLALLVFFSFWHSSLFLGFAQLLWKDMCWSFLMNLVGGFFLLLFGVFL